jgi:hypothetical protein
MTVHGDDLHVFGVHGHSVGSDDFFANLRRGVNVGASPFGTKAALGSLRFWPRIQHRSGRTN